MNKHILMVIDHQLNPDKYTQEQLEDNADAAANAAVDAADYYAADDAYAVADYFVYFAAVAEADYFVYFAAVAEADYWLDRYFTHTGENKQDYIDAINKDNKQ